MSFTPEQIMAYADGELDTVSARRLERAMEADPDLAAQVEEHRALRRRLSGRFDPVLDEPVPRRLSAPLETVDTSLAQRREARRRLSAPMQWGAIAAALVLGLFAGYQVRPDGIVTPTDRGLIAQGRLEGALDKQLASTQGTSPDIRIGLSFRDDTGTFCRSFEAAALSGIACRSEGDWQLRRTFPGAAASEFRQAASGELAEAVERMMSAEGPLDAAEEARARDAEWKAPDS